MAHLRVRRDSCRLFGRGDGVHVNRACRRSPLAAETATVRRHVGQVERTARTWTDAHREEARRLQAEGLSWSAIAEQVCGDRRYRAPCRGGCAPRRRQVSGGSCFAFSVWPTSPVTVQTA